MWTEAATFVAVIVFLYYYYFRKPSYLPPGSFGLPIVGQIPPLDKPLLHHLEELRNKYGNIFTTKWGSRIVVVLTDYELIKKTFSRAEFQGRPEFHSFLLFNHFMNLGIINANGRVWNDNRRFMLRQLRDLGFGKTKLEESIQEEASQLVDYLEQNCLDHPNELGWSVNVSVLNVIWRLVADRRYAADDKQIVDFAKLINQDIDVMQGPAVLLDIMPWLLSVLPNFVKNKVMKINFMEHNRDLFDAYVEKILKEHKETLDPDNPRDFIDHYLTEVENQKDDPSSTFRPDLMNLTSCIGDSFVAGSETTSTTIRWTVLYLAIHQDIQAKIHKLLDDEVPEDRLPSLQDRENLTYIDATIYEVLRISSLAPIGLMHCATSDATINEYRIPKGTILLASTETCHRSQHYWERPDEFYPEHFIDENGKLNTKKEGFLPFSLGRRQCLGESLAKMELYLFISALLQKFKILPPDGVTLKAETDFTKKLFNMPKPFKVILKKRN